jgi:hypothetical protein
VSGRSDTSLSFEKRANKAGECPSPFWVEDMDTRTERVVLVDGRDAPFQPLWLLFELRTGVLTRLGAARDFGFFLTADILGEASSS